ncbi:MAG: tetratricopeptide repeat protein [Candidatus Melainabacteria bacterium]|nr:tetratricopeptide repeat protein [Candidatus Melainabacteria bacterium]
MKKTAAILAVLLSCSLALHARAEASSAGADEPGSRLSRGATVAGAVAGGYDAALRSRFLLRSVPVLLSRRKIVGRRVQRAASKSCEFGRTLLVAGEDAASIEYFSRALELNPSHYAALVNRSVALANLERYSEAERDLLLATVVTSDAAAAYNNLGTIYEEQNLKVLARHCYERSIALEPEWDDQMCNLLSLLDDQGEYSELLVQSRLAVQRFPSTEFGYDYLSQALLETNRFEEAAEVLERGLKFCSDSKVLASRKKIIASAALDYYLRKGYDWEVSKNSGKALDCYSKVIRMAPTDSRGYEYRGGLRDRLGDHSNALRDFDMACRLEPDRDELFLQRAYCRANVGDSAGAIADASRGIRRRRDSRTLALRGMLFCSIEEYKLSIVDLDEVLAEDTPPLEIQSLFSRCRARWRTGDVVGAFGDFVALELKLDQPGDFMEQVAYCFQ